MGEPSAFSWNSELPSGRNPFWIRDEALAGLGLHAGDAVSVDTRAEPRNGDLVVVEVELEDDSLRTARRYVASGDRIHLEPVGAADVETIVVAEDQMIVMGVVRARLRFATDRGPPVEEPLAVQ
jgi:SOS-response transcriptional repressor LexA